MKKWLTILLILSLLISALGCAATPTAPAAEEAPPAAEAVAPAAEAAPAPVEDEGLRIAVAHHTLSDEWSKAVYDEFKEQAEAFGFAELNIQNAELDIEEQARIVEDFITQGYDAIIIDPISEEGMNATLEKAGAAGIPVFAYDSFTTYDKLIAHVAWDHAETGVVSAQWVADYAKENLGGKIRVGVLQMLNYEHTAIRGTTFKETLEQELGVDNIEYVYDLDYGETIESAANIVSNNLAKPVDVIWGAVDNATMGARATLEINSVPNTIAVSAGSWGADAFNLINNGDPYFKMCVGVSPANIVTLSLQAVQDHFEGKEVELRQNIELVLIDGENIADYMKYVQ